MVGSRNKEYEGDLFPRGAGLNSTPRVKKRNGQILFGPQLKKPRQTQGNNDAPVADAPKHHGGSLSFSRLSAGMTTLALVTRTDFEAVEFIIPGGIRAAADPDEVLIQRLSKRGTTSLKREISDSESSDTDGERMEDVPIPLYEALNVGSVLRVSVIDIDGNYNGRKVVRVSLKPELVNVGLNPKHVLKKGFPLCGAVKSVEDHGYTVSFGTSIPHRGFLAFTKCHISQEEKSLPIGTPVDVVTLSEVHLPKKRTKNFSAVVKLSSIRSDVLNATLESSEALTYRDLSAGVAVKAKVVQKGDGGVTLTAFGVFDIAVDAAHIPRLEDGTLDIAIGKQVRTRLLFVDSALKRIGGTLLNVLVKNLSPRNIPSALRTGTVLQNLVVDRIISGFGVLFRFSPKEINEEDMIGDSGRTSEEYGTNALHIEHENVQQYMRGIPLFAHLSRVSDAKGLKLHSMFHHGMVLDNPARVISVSRFDGIINVDLRSSVLSRKALCIEEVEVGAVYDCRILSHTTLGSVSVAVDGDPYLNGLVPHMHVSDVPIPTSRLSKHPHLRIGALLKCRVLNVKVDRGKIYLTARKSLVNPVYPVLSSFDQAKSALEASISGSTSGALFSGTSRRVTSKGSLLVEFCNGVNGLVRSSDLSLDEDKRKTPSDIETVYPIGETVHIRVVDADPINRRLLLSMCLGRSQETTELSLQVGRTVSGKITGVDEQTKSFVVLVHGSRVPGSELDGKESYTSSGKRDAPPIFHLPFGHLSDDPGLSERLAIELKRELRTEVQGSSNGIDLKELLVLSSGMGVPVLSMKHSLIQSAKAEELPKTFEDIHTLVKSDKKGKKIMLCGYVKALLSGGVIIGFLGDVVGFVRKSRIADQFVSDPARFLKMHQSCNVTLEDIDVPKRRFSLSMRDSDVGREGYEERCRQLFPCINEWKFILNRKTSQMKSLEKLYKVGTIIEAQPSSTRPFGTLYSLKAGDFDAIGVSLNTSEVNPEVILDGDHESSFSMDKINVENSEEAKSLQSKKHTLRVLDVDPFSGVVDLSTDKDVISGGHEKCSVSSNRKVSARVVLVKKMYVILKVEISANRSLMAFAPSPALQDGLVIRPGASVSGVILQGGSNHGTRVVMMADWMKFRDRSSPLKDAKPLGALSEVTSIPMLKSMASQDESAVDGVKVSGVVTKVFPTHAYVGIGRGVVGHLHITRTGIVSQEEIDALPLGPVPEQYASRLSIPPVGTIIRPAFVCGVRATEDEEHGVPMALELALHENSSNPVWQVGHKVIGVLQSISQKILKHSGESDVHKMPINVTSVAVGPNIRVSCADVNCLFDDSSMPLKVGLQVVCMICEVNDQKPAKGIISSNGEEHSESFLGIVREVIPGHGIKVMIPWHARSAERKSIPWGMVDICDVSSNFDDVVKKMETFREGDVVRVRRVPRIVGNDQRENEIVFLSMRNPKLDDESRDPLITAASAGSLEAGTIIRGFVRAIDKKGCFVSIGRSMSAHVKLCDLSDEYVVNPDKTFPRGTLVQGKIEREKDNPARISLVLRKRPRKKLGDDREPVTLSEGTTVSGFVRRVEPYGALIEVEKGVSALLHKSEVDQDRFIENTFEEWVVGQKVTAIVIKAENGKYKLGTKRCYFDAAGMNSTEVSAVLEKNQKAKSQTADDKRGEGDDMSAKDDDDMDGELVSDAEGQLNNGSDSPDEDSDTYDVDVEGTVIQGYGKEIQSSSALEDRDIPPSVTPLQISSGFEFEDPSVDKESNLKGGFTQEEDLDNKLSDSGVDHSKKRTREKRENKRRREAMETEVRIREETIANNPDSPETVEDYERLLMGQPNNSVLWIRYMAFCLGLSQIDKARSVAERALESISLESEDERVNLWCAYVNLEAEFGMMNAKDPELNDSMGIKRDAAVLRIFERACERITNVKDFHLRVASALRKSNPGLAEEIMQRAVRRFKGFEDVWVARGQALFTSGDLQAARQTLERALITLDKQKHIAVISKFAQFEYKHGTSERGRTVFESLVGSFPKRLDLWNVYLDMEIRRCRDASHDTQSDITRQVRTLFQRLVGRDFSSKKMKFVFKKWLNFEKTFGSKESQKEVKQKAREYVERNVSNSA